MFESSVPTGCLMRPGVSGSPWRSINSGEPRSNRESRMELKSFEELAMYIRQFQTWDNRGGYDFAGMAHLLGACLDNLRRYASTDEIEEMPKFLEPQQWALLKRIMDPSTNEPSF